MRTDGRPRATLKSGLALGLCAASLCLPSPRPAAAAGSPAAGERVALVVGNSAYKGARLKNPANDARDIAKKLKKLGFAVIVERNADKRSLLGAVERFAKRLGGAKTGLFFYAGHGMQVRGANYLIPVKSSVKRESDIEFEGVQARRVLAAMEDSGVQTSIVILDACRNNPFARSFRSSARGLAVMPAGRQTFLSYATAPGAVAADGAGRNGVYTKHLLRNIATPGIPIEEVFKRVRAGVVAETDGGQIPWDSSSLLTSFSFAGGSPAASPAPPSKPARPSAPLDAHQQALVAQVEDAVKKREIGMAGFRLGHRQDPKSPPGCADPAAFDEVARGMAVLLSHYYLARAKFRGLPTAEMSYTVDEQEAGISISAAKLLGDASAEAVIAAAGRKLSHMDEDDQHALGAAVRLLLRYHGLYVANARPEHRLILDNIQWMPPDTFVKLGYPRDPDPCVRDVELDLDQIRIAGREHATYIYMGIPLEAYAYGFWYRRQRDGTLDRVHKLLQFAAVALP